MLNAKKFAKFALVGSLFAGTGARVYLKKTDTTKSPK